MSEPCLEPCPAHLCLEMTKAGMCRHEVARLRSQLATLQARCEAAEAERDEAKALAAERYVEQEALHALLGEPYQSSAVATLTTERDAARTEVERLKQTVKAFITAKDSTAREFNGLVNDIAAGVRTETAEQIAAWLDDPTNGRRATALTVADIRAGAWRKEQG